MRLGTSYLPWMVCAAVALAATPASAIVGSSDEPVDETHGFVGEVPAVLSVTLSGPVSFGTMTPGVDREYSATTTAHVTTTAATAMLTVSDRSDTEPGHLVNGTYTLPSPLKVAGSPLPATLKTYTGPVTHNDVTIGFTQAIAETDSLRAGTYRKALTFTLSTTEP